MLRCPTCNLTFPDNALAFCTEDGARLVPDAQASNSQPTLQASPYGNAPQQYAPQQYAPQPQQWAQPQARSGGGSKLLIGVLIGLLLAGGVGVGIYFLTKGSGSSPASNGSSSTSSSSSTSNPSTPTEVWEAVYAAAQKRDVAALKKLMSKAALDEATRAPGNMSSDELFSSFLKEVSASGTSETRNEEITGDTATVEIRETSGEWGKAGFVKENGSWKFRGTEQRPSPISNTNTPKK
jgi:hypothetical protein